MGAVTPGLTRGYGRATGLPPPAERAVLGKGLGDELGLIVLV